MKALPLYDDTVPVVCTVGQDEIPARIEQIEAMRTSLRSLERIEHGLFLTFDRSTYVTVAQFALDEKRCCTFWGFEVVSDADTVTLRWDGPPTARPILDRIATFFEGTEPAGALGGLF